MFTSLFKSASLFGAADRVHMFSKECECDAESECDAINLELSIINRLRPTGCAWSQKVSNFLLSSCAHTDEE